MEGAAFGLEGVPLGLELGGGLFLLRMFRAQGLERLVEGAAFGLEGVPQRFHLHKAVFDRRRSSCSL